MPSSSKSLIWEIYCAEKIAKNNYLATEQRLKRFNLPLTHFYRTGSNGSLSLGHNKYSLLWAATLMRAQEGPIPEGLEHLPSTIRLKVK